MTKKWSSTVSGDGRTKQQASKSARREGEKKQAKEESEDYGESVLGFRPGVDEDA